MASNTSGGGRTVLADVGQGAASSIFLGNYNSAGYGALNVSVVTVNGCAIDMNQAQGGGDGNGEGGGIANVLDATTMVASSFIILNQMTQAAGPAWAAAPTMTPPQAWR